MEAWGATPGSLNGKRERVLAVEHSDRRNRISHTMGSRSGTQSLVSELPERPRREANQFHRG